ncbi:MULTISPECIES: holin [Clostridia]|uniref:holin n=1 Tax=Clostridia TaxID=186801 RepID=UPI00067EF78D|nr:MULTISPECIES: holin [Clostridia]
MKNRDWIEWAKRAEIRAVKTIAQAAIAGIGTAAVMSQVDIKYVISASLLAGVLSLLTSVAGLPEIGNTETTEGE